MAEGGFSGNETTDIGTQNVNSEVVSKTEERDELMINALLQLNSLLPNLKVVIGDSEVDDITEKQLEISEIKGE